MGLRTVSLDDATYSRLVVYRANLEIGVAKNPNGYPRWLREARLSLDSAVAYLLDQQEAHTQRAKRAREKAKDKPFSADQWEGQWGPDDTVSLPPEVLPSGE